MADSRDAKQEESQDDAETSATSREDEEDHPPFSVKDIATIVDTKPASALLTPAFTELGNYFGERAADWVAAQKRRREKNLRSHVEAVLENTKPKLDRYGPTERQAAETAEWAQYAQSIDPVKEAELSALWQGLLSAIYADDDDVREMQTALQGMTTRDARLLLSMGSRWRKIDEDNPSVDKLITLRLAKRGRLTDLFSPATVALTFAVGGLLVFSFLVPDLFQPFLSYEGLTSTYATMQIQLIRATAIIAAIMALLVAGYWAIRRINSLRVTHLGRRLQLSGNEYLVTARRTPDDR